MRLGSTLAVSAPSYQVAGAGRALFAGSMTEDDMSLVGTGRATMLTALAGQITHVSLHTADPGDSGTSEVSGGSYARVAASWGTATATSVTLASTTWTIPAGTPTHVGFWTALSGGTFIGSARLANPSARSAGSFTVPSTVIYLDAGDILVSQGALDDFRLVLHNGGLLQAPLRLDSDCVLVVDPTGFYDAEQRAVLNSSLITSRTALAVGLGNAGCAGPIWHTDKLGDVAWFGQTLAAAYVSCTVPALTSASTFTIEGTYGGPIPPAADVLLASFSGGAYVQFESSGEITFFDGSAADTSASTVATLLSISDDWAEFEWRAVPAGTSLNIDVRLPGGSWVAAVSGATIAAVSPAGQTLYCGSSSTTKGLRAKVRRLTVRDGGTGASKVAEFLPSMFVPGNRADGDIAVDAYGVTWTVERPAATPDMPRVVAAQSVQRITLPGKGGEYVSTPDTAALSITGDIDLRIRVQLPAGRTTPATTATLISKRESGKRSYWFRMNTNGSLALSASTDGLVDAWTAVSDAQAWTADTLVWLRVTMASATGLVNHYYAYDDTMDSTEVAAWSLMGGSGDVMGATVIADTTSALMVGATWTSGSADPADLDFYVAEVWDGIDGTLVERIDAAEANANATTWTSSTSSAVVTVNRSATAQNHARIVAAGVAIIQADGSNDFAEVCGDDSIAWFDPAVGLTILGDFVLFSGSASYGRLVDGTDPSTNDGVYVARHVSNQRVYGRIDDGTTSTAVGDGSDNITYGDVEHLAMAFGGTHQAFINATSAGTSPTAISAISSGYGLRMFATHAGASFANAEMRSLAVVRRRMTDTSPPSEVQTVYSEGVGA